MHVLLVIAVLWFFWLSITIWSGDSLDRWADGTRILIVQLIFKSLTRVKNHCGFKDRSLKRFSVHYAMHVFVFDGNWRSCVFYSLRRLYCPCIIFQTVTQPWMVNLHFLPLSSALLRSIMFHTLTYKKNILPTCTKRRHACNTCFV